LLWELAVRALSVRPVLLPAPSAILRALISNWPAVWRHTCATGTELFLGFALGAALGLGLALLFHSSGILRSILEPYVVSSQLVPKAALAPLLIIWLGLGLAPKVVVAALVCFFPTFINAYAGLSACDPDLLLMMRCLRAAPSTTLLRLQLPWAVPYILAGLRTSALFAVTGVVVAEFVGADKGLGYLLLSAEGSLDTPMVFAALAALSALGALAYAVPVVIERTVFRRYMPADPPHLGAA
jgi:NitT/TauT family transport system permease protein